MTDADATQRYKLNAQVNQTLIVKTTPDIPTDQDEEDVVEEGDEDVID